MALFDKDRWGKIFVVFCSIAISVVVAEVGLRFASAGYLATPLDGHPVLHHAQPPNFVFTSFDMAEEFGGHSVIYDGDGFRVPHDRYEFDDSLKDIVFLGDSFVEASELPYDQTFVGMFGKEIENLNVRNFGVSSYSPVISYLQLKYYLNTIEPVMIVHLVFENDLEDDTRYFNLARRENGTITAVPGEPRNAVHRFLRRSYVARLVNRAILTLKKLANNSVGDESNNLSFYLEDPELGEITPLYIGKISQLSKENGIRYLLMCVPSKLKLNNFLEHKDMCEKIRQLANMSDIEYVDLDKFFLQNADGGKPFFERNIHFNATGHRLTYLALEHYLKSTPHGVE